MLQCNFLPLFCHCFAEALYVAYGTLRTVTVTERVVRKSVGTWMPKPAITIGHHPSAPIPSSRLLIHLETLHLVFFQGLWALVGRQACKEVDIGSGPHRFTPKICSGRCYVSSGMAYFSSFFGCTTSVPRPSDPRFASRHPSFAAEPSTRHRWSLMHVRCDRSTWKMFGRPPIYTKWIQTFCIWLHEHGSTRLNSDYVELHCILSAHYITLH